jgi:nucleotide-binding universal stress UspA family protein
MSAGVLVGYDGSAGSKAALAAAAEVAKAYGDSLTIVFSYELNPLGGDMPEYGAAVREVANKRLAEARELAPAGAELAIVEREPAHGLAELARDRDARVIVVGSNGEGPLRGALLGSTPYKLLALADRPVLVVPAKL